MHLLLFNSWLLHRVVHFYPSFSSVIQSCHKIWRVSIIRHGWNDGTKVSMRTSSVFLLDLIGLKSNVYMCLFARAYISILFIKNIILLVKMFDRWNVCMSVCVFWTFLRPLFSQLRVEGSWICFLLLRFVEHHNEIEIGDFFSAFFFFPFQKNCCAEPRIVLLVVTLLWLLAKAMFWAWNILRDD